MKVKTAVRLSSAPLLTTGNTTRSSMMPADAALKTPASVIAPVASPAGKLAVKLKVLVKTWKLLEELL